MAGWLFQLNMLSCFHGHQCARSVPMVRSSDKNSIEIVRFQHLSNILMPSWLVAGCILNRFNSLSYRSRVYVTNIGHDATPLFFVGESSSQRVPLTFTPIPAMRMRSLTP